jgi:superfamily II DNA or RNA helicase
METPIVNSLYNKKEFQRDILNQDNVYLKPHQLFVRNYLGYTSKEDRLLLYHQTGTGKTLSAIVLLKSFVEELYTHYNSKSPKIMVFVKNNTIKENFKKEIEKFNQKTGISPDDPQLKIIFKTYQAFTNDINRIGPTNMEPFGNSIIIMDEIHNILNNTLGEAFVSFLRHQNNFKLLALSATPVYDNVEELYHLINLLCCPTEITMEQLGLTRQQLYTDANTQLLENTSVFSNNIFKITQETKEIVKRLLSDKISYLDVDVSTFPALEEYLVPCKMSPEHTTAYLDTFQTGGRGIGTYQKQSQILNYYGTTFKFETKEQIKEFAPKIYSIAENIQKSPNGIHLVFSEYIERYGTNLVEAALRLYSFTKRINNDYKTMAVFTGKENTSAAIKTKILHVINSPENKDGKIIKIIIVSKVFAEGVDFKNIQHVHILDPLWNKSSIDQLIGRARREMSHNLLEKAQQIVKVYKYQSVTGTTVKTVDEMKYDLLDAKSNNTQELLNYFKHIAIDCIFNLERNTPGNPGLRCAQIKDQNASIDYTTYVPELHKYFILKNIDAKLRYLFSKVIVISFDDLYRLLNKYTKEDIIYCVNKYTLENKQIYYQNTKGSLQNLNDTFIIFLPYLSGEKDTLLERLTVVNYAKPNTTNEEKKEIIDISQETVKGSVEGKSKQMTNIVMGTYTNRAGIQDNIFRVLYNPYGTEATNKKTELSGQVCGTIPKPKLREYLGLLGVAESELEKKPKTELCGILEDTLKKNNFII